MDKLLEKLNGEFYGLNLAMRVSKRIREQTPDTPVEPSAVFRVTKEVIKDMKNEIKRHQANS